MQQSYTIRELAQEFGITARTMRHYEELGLLAPTRRGQARVYSVADRTRLKLILRGKRLGLSLEESREIIAMYDPEHGNEQQLRRLLERVREQRSALQARLADLQAMLAELDAVESGCLASLAGAESAPTRPARPARRRGTR
jgi:DNA-binding transcriptional MerR regulator